MQHRVWNIEAAPSSSARVQPIRLPALRTGKNERAASNAGIMVRC